MADSQLEILNKVGVSVGRPISAIRFALAEAELEADLARDELKRAKAAL